MHYKQRESKKKLEEHEKRQVVEMQHVDYGLSYILYSLFSKNAGLWVISRVNSGVVIFLTSLNFDS